jgi:hypothetical protein
VYWNEVAQLLSPVAPASIMICPMREELQLTRWLWNVTPEPFRVDYTVEDQDRSTAVSEVTDPPHDPGSICIVFIVRVVPFQSALHCSSPGVSAQPQRRRPHADRHCIERPCDSYTMTVKAYTKGWGRPLSIHTVSFVVIVPCMFMYIGRV